MRIGILSDTHGRIESARAGLSALRAANAEFLAHCGDIGGQEIIDLLAAAGAPSVFVFGNCDFDQPALAHYAEAVGVRCEPVLAELELAGKRIAVTHGDRTKLMQQIINEGKCDYLLHGHTHIMRDEKVGTVRIINPGALYRAKQLTVATLDLETGILRFLPIDCPDHSSS
ncbi:MAG TPA: YfcE family phosphodiesterase [Tepidisphaeraceae bacterium]|nr:YfcE family phosphodiesterase [Tepidisphaeraceae bacterium]